nr:MAG TPA: hypothetical protein [Bacteriophage sp.]
MKLQNYILMFLYQKLKRSLIMDGDSFINAIVLVLMF